MRRHTFTAALGAVVLAMIAVSPAEASNAFGTHVADCAQRSLGQRADAPQVTCTHDGHSMTFPTFGAMVQHMREMQG